MDFDIVSMALGAAAGFLAAASIGRLKFAEIQEELREVKGRAARELRDVKLNKRGITDRTPKPTLLPDSADVTSK